MRRPRPLAVLPVLAPLSHVFLIFELSFLHSFHPPFLDLIFQFTSLLFGNPACLVFFERLILSDFGARPLVLEFQN